MYYIGTSVGNVAMALFMSHGTVVARYAIEVFTFLALVEPFRR